MKITIQLEANDDGRIQLIESEKDFNSFVDEIENRLEALWDFYSPAKVQEKPSAKEMLARRFCEYAAQLRSKLPTSEKPRQLTNAERLKVLEIAAKGEGLGESVEDRYRALIDLILNFKEQANGEK